MIAMIDGGGGSDDTKALRPASPPPPPTLVGQSGDSSTGGNSTTAVAAAPDAIAPSGSTTTPTPTLLDAAQSLHPGSTGSSPWFDSDPFNLGSSALKGATQADPKSWFPQGPLAPNSSITDPNGYTYQSDRFGRPNRAFTDDLQYSNGPRTAAARNAQNAAGGADRLPTDQGGHHLGHQFGGRDDAWNLTPQDDNLNHSAYRQMENSWRNAIDPAKGAGPQTVAPDVRAVYDQPNLRPTAYVGNATVDGVPQPQRVMPNAPSAGFTSDLGNVGKNEAFLNTVGKVSEGLDTFGKVAMPVAVAADGYRLYNAFEQDGGTIGKHTLETGGSVAGGWAGAAVGAETGAEVGAGVGAMFGGVGAVPGAIIGGLAGGVVGGIAGSEIGQDAVKVGEKVGGALVDAGKSAVNTVSSAAKSVASFFGF
jgi:hypothetical protein